MENNQTTAAAQSGGNADSGAQVDTSAMDAEIQQITSQLCSGNLLPGTRAYNDLLARQNALHEKRYPGNVDNQTMPPTAAGSEPIETLRARVQSLMQTPGYADGGLKNTNNPEYNRVIEKIMSARNQIAAQEAVAGAKEIAGMTQQIAAQTVLQAEGRRELLALKKLGFDGMDKLPKDFSEVHVQGWKQQRLLAEGKLDEVTPLVSADLQALMPQSGYQAKTMFEGFMNNPEFDTGLKEKIAELIIAHNFEMKRQK